MKKVLLISCVFLLSNFGIMASGYGATYYVDWDEGSNSYNGLYETYQGGSNGPWQTPWYADGNVGNGDTVIVAARDDGNPYNNGNNRVIEVPTGSTWQAKSGETVKLSITSNWQDCNSGVPTGSYVVSLGGDNSTVDGFYIWGQLGISGDNNTVENCDISGGVGARDHFVSPVYIHGKGRSSRATGNYIYNTAIHDGCSIGAYCNGKKSDQCPLVMSYYDENTVFENCEFYNPNGPAIRHKGLTYNVTVKESFFHDLADGFGALYGSEDGGSGDQNWHHNIIVGNGSQIAFSPKSVASGYKYFIHNNIVYNTRGIHYWTKWRQVESFNNIYYATGSRRMAYSESGFGLERFDYLDYNQYHFTSGSPDWFGEAGLNAWKSYLIYQSEEVDTREMNSISTNPNFNPDDGNLDGSDPTDFKRSSYPTDGRGGGWPSKRGPYITGYEKIGLLGSIPPPPPPPGLASPQNLRIVMQ